MGKMKEQRGELMNSFSRMNFLFQAAVVASKAVPDSILGNYYGRLMKEVSKKLVEKIHPDIKRALCSSCSYPLFTNDNHASVKVKPHRRKKNKRRTKNKVKRRLFEKAEFIQNSDMRQSCVESRSMKKDLKPNRVLWSCNKCGFNRAFLQRPSHSLWIDICQDHRSPNQQDELKSND